MMQGIRTDFRLLMALGNGGIAAAPPPPPLNPPLSGLLTWFRGDKDVYGDIGGTIPAGNGLPVNVWKDQIIGNKAVPTSTPSTPIYAAGLPIAGANKPCIVFGSSTLGPTTAANTFFATVSPMNGSFASGTPFSIFLVTQMMRDSCVLGNNGGGGHGALNNQARVFYPNNLGVMFSSGGASQSNNVPRSVDVPNLVEMIFDGTNVVYYENGTFVPNVGVSPPGPTGFYLDAIGALSSFAALYALGNVWEILVYNSAVSTVNRQAIETYIQARYPGLF